MRTRRLPALFDRGNSWEPGVFGWTVRLVLPPMFELVRESVDLAPASRSHHLGIVVGVQSSPVP